MQNSYPYRDGLLILARMKNTDSSCPICNGITRQFLKDLYDDRYGYPGLYSVRVCGQCGHKYLDANFSADQLVHLYSNYYPRGSFKLEDYQPISFQDTFREWFNGEKRAFAYVPSNVRVLDIGCGFGEALGYHKKRGCEVFGIEADQNILRVGEKFGFNVKAGVFGPGLYEDNFFDYITMDQVLEHSTNPIELLTAIQKTLKPGGKLIITIPNANGNGAYFFGRKWIHWHTPYHLQFFSNESLKHSAQKAGLQIIKKETVTSSEWLYYQGIHNIAFPEKMGEPSFFWSPKKDWNLVGEKVLSQRNKINRLHKKKIYHIITRLMDFFGWGDNFLFVLKKPNP